MADWVLVGGHVVDGSGSPPRAADVLISGDRIQKIIERPEARQDDVAVQSEDDGVGSASSDTVGIRNVRGMVVMPGFIDVHTHSDLTILSNPAAESKVRQGVTTEVVGNCGLGVAPLAERGDVGRIRESVSYLDLDPLVSWSWRDTSGYLSVVEEVRPSLNIATLTGHLPLRASVIGFANRGASHAELAEMNAMLADSFAAGSLGLSTGLVYAPICYAREDELLALGHTVASYDRVFSWHVRNYADSLVASVQQALDVARATGCRTQISHLTAVGRRNWGSVLTVLNRIAAARDEGLDVAVDIYPYLYGNAPLAQLLPDWVQEGGSQEMSHRLREAGVRREVREAWLERPTTWQDVRLNWLPSHHELASHVGKSLATIAAEQCTDADEFVLDLLAELGTQVMIIAGGRSEDDLRAVMEDPACLIASDGQCLDPSGTTGAGKPHPRSYGCFPRYLSRYAGPSDDDFAKAVRRCTAVPAQQLRIPDRGILRDGAFADLVVVAKDRLKDRATLASPQQYPVGINLVVVNGTVVVDNGRRPADRPGQVIRRET